MPFEKPPEYLYDPAKSAAARGLLSVQRNVPEVATTGDGAEDEAPSSPSEVFLQSLLTDPAVSSQLEVWHVLTARERATIAAQSLRLGEARPAIYNEISAFTQWLRELRSHGALVQEPLTQRLMDDLEQKEKDLVAQARQQLESMPYYAVQLADALLSCLATQSADVLESQLRWLGKLKQLLQSIVLILSSDYREQAEGYALGDAVDALMSRLVQQGSVASAMDRQLQAIIGGLICPAVSNELLDLIGTPVRNEYDRWIAKLNNFQGQTIFQYQRSLHGLEKSGLAAKVAIAVGVIELIEQTVEAARRSPRSLTAALGEQHDTAMAQAAKAKPSIDPAMAFATALAEAAKRKKLEADPALALATALAAAAEAKKKEADGSSN